MKTIHKYELGSIGAKMPAGARVLHCAVQGDLHCIWALVDTDQELVQRKFEVIGTGWDVEDNMTYVATYFEHKYVWHLMEVL